MSSREHHSPPPQMDSHETNVSMFNGNKIGEIFVACSPAINGWSLFSIGLVTLIIGVFWWKYPGDFYTIIHNGFTTAAGFTTLMMWIVVIGAGSGVGGLILNKGLLPFMNGVKEIFWPTPKVLAINDNFTVYSTRSGIQVHDHQESKVVENYKIDMAKMQEQQALPAPAALRLPDTCYMTDVMRDFDLSLDSIFLALGKGSEPISCSLEGFMHVAHDGPTGKGKTVLSYAELVMLLKLGVRIILCNPHFAPMDKKGRDWRPIGRAIEAQGMVELAPGKVVPGLIRRCDNIERMLKWLSTQEINRRFDMQARGDYTYSPIYLFIDEWPVIVSECPDAALSLADILRRGRAVEVCVSANAQGFLVDDVNLKGSARENFNTAYHLGGSVHSAAKLLDMPVKDINALLRAEQVTLGGGVALLRNNEACPQAQLVRLPYATNDFAYYMLGRAEEWQLPEVRTKKPEVVQEVAQEAAGSGIDVSYDMSTIRILRDIGKRLKNGESDTEIIKSYGLPWGRATQELKATVDFVAQYVDEEGL